MKVELKRVDKNFHFEASGVSNVKVNIDGAESIGGSNSGARPMELILMGLGGCSAIDILSILRKQKIEPTSFEIEINAVRREKIPSIFTKIEVVYKVTGEVDESKLKRAIDLSVEKYCSVSEILNKTADITYTYEISK
ncbi:MAG: OsmC family protein [Melioribacteraceae bacterium]|nr:OsmC family protein [Melioribacteraceae bacterium]MCF8264389.1 OsmC family protein [Melioribacteraceae bacterium]MCF8432076.1 OsmC family protein [Melioribacteraceae bacterium]